MPINIKIYEHNLRKLPAERINNTNPIVINRELKADLVCQYLLIEMAMPTHQIDTLQVHRVWSADRPNWQTVFVSFGDIESVQKVYQYASSLVNPNYLTKHVPASMHSLVDFCESHLKIRDEAKISGLPVSTDLHYCDQGIELRVRPKGDIQGAPAINCGL